MVEIVDSDAGESSAGAAVLEVANPAGAHQLHRGADLLLTSVFHEAG